MQKGKQKGKNIVVATRDSHNSLELGFGSKLSYGAFQIGELIDKYLANVELEPHGKYLNWDSYLVKDLVGVHLWCSSSKIVYAMRFDTHCFYKGQDLIRMPIFSFLKMLNKEPRKVEVLWSPTKDDNHGQNQHVYDIDLNRSGSKVLQVWTWRKRIVSIMVFDISFQD